MSTWPPTDKPVIRPAKIPEGHWDVVVGNVSSPFATRERAEEVAEIISQSKNPCIDMWHLYMLDSMPDTIMEQI